MNSEENQLPVEQWIEEKFPGLLEDLRTHAEIADLSDFARLAAISFRDHLSRAVTKKSKLK